MNISSLRNALTANTLRTNANAVRIEKLIKLAPKLQKIRREAVLARKKKQNKLQKLQKQLNIIQNTNCEMKSTRTRKPVVRFTPQTVRRVKSKKTACEISNNSRMKRKASTKIKQNNNRKILFNSARCPIPSTQNKTPAQKAAITRALRTHLKKNLNNSGLTNLFASMKA